MSRGNMSLGQWLLFLVDKRITYKGVYHITNRLDKIIARLVFILDE